MYLQLVKFNTISGNESANTQHCVRHQLLTAVTMKIRVLYRVYLSSRTGTRQLYSVGKLPHRDSSGA